MTAFYFIRHGKPDMTEANTMIYQGMGFHMQPLSAIGVEQALETAKDRRLCNATLILTSPFGRALHTAAVLSKELQLPITVETDLHEWCADRDYVYLPDEEAVASFREMTKNKAVNPPDKKHNWESVNDMRQRVYGVLEKYSGLDAAIVVCHGCLMQYVLGMDHHPENCEIVEFLYNNKTFITERPRLKPLKRC